MDWFWIVALAWLILFVPAAVLLGRYVLRLDSEDAARAGSPARDDGRASARPPESGASAGPGGPSGTGHQDGHRKQPASSELRS